MPATGEPPSPARSQRPPDTLLDRYYRQTEYRVEIRDSTLTIRVGAQDPETDSCLQELFGTLREWAIITPCNPGSIPLCETENQIRLAEMHAAVRARDYRWLRSVNHDPREEWPDEPGVMILGIPQSEAEALGRRLGQNAIVCGEPGAPPRLVWLRDPAGAAASPPRKP